jgi:hypothetical protein
MMTNPVGPQQKSAFVVGEREKKNMVYIENKIY